MDAFVGRSAESAQTGQVTVNVLGAGGVGRGNVDIGATGASEADATSASFNFAGLAAVTLIRADSDLLGSTRAYIGNRVNLTAGDVNIHAEEAVAKSNATMIGATVESALSLKSAGGNELQGSTCRTRANRRREPTFRRPSAQPAQGCHDVERRFVMTMRVEVDGTLKYFQVAQESRLI